MNTLKQLIQYHDLSQQEMKSFVDLMMDEQADVSLKVAHLVALSMKGETSDELSNLSQSLIETTYKERPYLEDSICVCGTGGDHSGSFNISTTASFVVAAAGLKVLKHGNKSITSKTGSIDILSALNIQTTPIKDATEKVNETNLAFLSATETYPIMKTVQPVRKSIPTPTTFNLLGPMIHPYHLDYQVMGVYDETKLKIIAEAIYKLGRKRAIIVHGAGGMDEATLSGDNIIYEVSQDEGIKHYIVNAEEYGLQSAPNESLKGGTPEENKVITLDILTGQDHGPKRDVVVLNAALALYAGQKVDSIKEGITLVESLIDDKHALNILEAVGGKVYDNIG
ncbi:anthranilate phosphoribosyltransferase [Mammaliicoccus sciuri]|uniref:anthranilate phosphoribosyltransferase n=1 Tax=Mammaliicoccus sciuri TaxID=1296 RepID=UPI000D1F64DF|nr:anthranilate phosphoribosyltransferase [Mammaliicoccus sciuri]MCJ0916703.1 anthranilate phosphoribosyltransferase [Mammaliicoccus sciuri]MCJ0936275.1 anthranilate phosphoribosyltransferase [Mammaliicoccus sciuri]MCO4322793.1 anthranilate phosphoribosyltransferase [Mammaliicoccus sciuri]MEB6231641.1 anthranilate phosphoribosyltransferase [Mammaliicoccus sciuri]MEB8263654.1 anthranilate phosphoribosyltransferase [Mammaliicoccus sciuri]